MTLIWPATPSPSGALTAVAEGLGQVAPGAAEQEPRGLARAGCAQHGAGVWVVASCQGTVQERLRGQKERLLA